MLFAIIHDITPVLRSSLQFCDARWVESHTHGCTQLRMPLPGEINYASLKRQPGPGRPEARGNAAPQAGTRQYEPSGKRYSIDRNAISYMGWTFQVSTYQIFVSWL